MTLHQTVENINLCTVSMYLMKANFNVEIIAKEVSFTLSNPMLKKVTKQITCFTKIIFEVLSWDDRYDQSLVSRYE